MDHVATHESPATRQSVVTFGFWIYIMSDCLIFGSLFAAFAVLEKQTFGGPALSELFSMPFVLAETMILLTSSFTCGLGLLSVYRNRAEEALSWFFLTFILGIAFVGLELTEFRQLILEGHGPSSSGAMSSFFALVGTHGFHVALGLVWMVVLMIYLASRGISEHAVRRFALLALFWHFLDIVWIFIFTIVYMLNFI